MTWIKKIFAFLLVGITALALTGCGNDLSGTYVMVTGDKFQWTSTLNVKKGDKDGYTMKYNSMGYRVIEWPGGSQRSGGDEVLRTTDIEATWHDSLLTNTLFVSKPDKSNNMVYKDTKSMGFMTGMLVLDENGDIIDETGQLTDVKGARFKKVKEINVEEIKKTLQEHVTANEHERFDYDRKDWEGMVHSKLGKVTFKD